VSPTSTTQYQYPRGRAILPRARLGGAHPDATGRGASEGDYLERYECDRATLTAGVERGIEDVEAALAFVSAQPWADPGRLLLGGQSRGGLLSVLYPSRREVNARGVINLRGGWMAERMRQRDALQRGVLRGGRPGRRAAHAWWMYSENDRNYRAAAFASLPSGVTQAGGRRSFTSFRPSVTTANPAAGRESSLERLPFTTS